MNRRDRRATAAIAALIGWLTMARTTATVGGAHFPALWLLAAAVVLALAAAVLYLVRVIIQDGLWLAPRTAGAP